MRVVTIVALLPVFVLLQGCATWQQRPFTPGEPPAVRSDQTLRVVHANGSMVVLESPHVVGDSLIGDIERSDLRYAIALSDIRRLEHRRHSPVRTVGMSLGVGAGLFVAAVVVGFIALALSALGGT